MLQRYRFKTCPPGLHFSQSRHQSRQLIEKSYRNKQSDPSKIVTGNNICNSCIVFFFSTKDNFWFESHQQKLPQHQDGDTSNNGHDLEGGHYLGVGDVVDGVKDDEVAGVGDGHEAEGDEGGEPDQLDCKVNQDHHCQGQLTKYHPEIRR